MNDDKPHRVQDAVNSTAALFAARILLPALLAIIGFFLVRTLNGIEAAQRGQGLDIASIKSDIRNVNTRLDERVIRTVEDNTQRINKLEDRVEVIERTVRTP